MASTDVPERSRLRVAMTAPEAHHTGGVPGLVAQLAKGLVDAGCAVDLFVPELGRPLDGRLERSGVRVVPIATGWRWGRWYNDPARPMLAHCSQLAVRSWAARRLVGCVLEEHRREPYDVLYRFSTIEMFGVRRHRRELPPVVVHPEVHAAGELRWSWRERHLSRRAEPWHRRAASLGLLAVRTARQRRDVRLVAGVVAPSATFARALAADYGVDGRAVAVVPNPVDLDRFAPTAGIAGGGGGAAGGPGGPRRVVFVGRLAVRKGVEQVVALSHRLAEPPGGFRLDVVGGPSQWSDYRALLDDLHPEVARVHGAVGNDRVAELLSAADVVVQPSAYEPFAITVAEALAAGTPVVATSAVGAAEAVRCEACVVVPAGDVAALEAAVRAVADRLDAGDGPALRASARRAAEVAFDPAAVGASLAEALGRLVGRPEVVAP